MSHRGGARGGARGGGPSRSSPQPPGGSPPEESRKYRDRAEERRRGIFMADDDEAPPAYNGNGSAHDAAGAGAGAGGVATYTSAAAKSILEASSDDDDDDPASAHLRYAPIAAPAAVTIDAATPSIFTPTLPAPAPAPAPAAARENSEPVFIPASKVHFMTAFARSVYDAAVSLPLQLRHGVPHPPALDEGTGPAKGSDRFLRGRQGLIFDTAAAPLQGALGTEALRAAELRGLSTPAASLPTAMTRAKETVVMHLALHLPSSNTSSSPATLSSSSSSSSAAAAAAATMLASGASGSIMTASLDASSDKHAGATGLRGSDAVIPLPARMDTDMLAKVHRAIEGRRRQLAGEVTVSSSGAGSAARTNAEKIAEADAAKKKKEEEEAAAAAATAAAANDDEFDIFADAGEYKPSYAVDATPDEVSSSSSSSSSAAKAAAEAERLYSHESSSSADTASLFGPHTSTTSTSSTSHSTTTTSSSSSHGVRTNHDDSHLLSSLSGFGAASLTRPRARTALRVAADGSIVAAEEADDAEYAAAVAAETGAIVELGREGLAELRERAEAAGAAVEGGRGRKRERDGAAPGGSGDDDEEGDGIDSSGRGGRGGAFDADADKRRREQRFESEFSALAKRLDIKTTGGGTEEGAEQTSKRARVLGMRR